MISANDLSAPELAALLHFHADAGVEWMLEDVAIDRFAEFEAMRAEQGKRPQPADRDAGSGPAPSAARPQASVNGSAGRQAAPARPAREAAPSAAVTIPDSQAVAEAEFAASSARSLDELRAAMEAFNGCNLKNSARSLVFASGNPKPAVMAIGAMPNADDDREGHPFSGRQGAMLDRMLAGIGIDRASVLVTNVIPWRPPGNRVPSVRESDICRPFIERQIALAEPNHVLIFGNFAARFFFGGTETIHEMRGVWREIHIGGRNVPAFATLHPLDLIAAPISKRLAWQDLLAFRKGVAV
ncbi:uracil-DNA glycosylase [Sinorhizobium sp. BG8]|uniref:uracil-DNA glycosylase n=1 Tax=Sinorhizobium sp. BG8 TaxID=2613773 RepID=UPI00193D3232|nr:uracil-DNA glycosylase [Sinorhizobium sp. BG8]QRM56860.1 uracil-DNA glycosylase [Sinorhizobium sp. BG8]